MRRRISRFLTIMLWVLCIPALAQTHGDRSPCMTCHSEAMTQPQTQMGRAFAFSESNPVLGTHPRLTFQKGRYIYTIESRGGHSTYSVSDGTQTISVPILWNFGADAQTWVLQRGDQLYESLVSYYPAIHGLDITTGDERPTPNTLDAAIGRPLTEMAAKACFGCHSTNAISHDKLDFQSLKPGVSCEHCHLGANQHLSDILDGKTESIPPDLGKRSSEEISEFCGKCHRTWETVVRSHWRGEANVRFQPYRLANSKCFNGADSRISCIACHDPHQQVITNESYYDAKCLACHSSSIKISKTSSATNIPTKKSCPISKSNCVSCHMPKVKMLGGHLTYTDHEIRIVKAGEAYPN